MHGERERRMVCEYIVPFLSCRVEPSGLLMRAAAADHSHQLAAAAGGIFDGLSDDCTSQSSGGLIETISAQRQSLTNS